MSLILFQLLHTVSCLLRIIYSSEAGGSTNKEGGGDTVEPRYNEVLGTMKITLLYQVSHYIRVQKQRNIKSWDHQNYLVIRGFCYIRPLSNEVPLYIHVSKRVAGWINSTQIINTLFRQKQKMQTLRRKQHTFDFLINWMHHTHDDTLGNGNVNENCQGEGDCLFIFLLYVENGWTRHLCKLQMEMGCATCQTCTICFHFLF